MYMYACKYNQVDRNEGEPLHVLSDSDQDKHAFMSHTSATRPCDQQSTETSFTHVFGKPVRSMYACISMQVSNTHTHTYRQIIHTHTPTCVLNSSLACMHVRTCTHTYTRTYRQIHTYTHVYSLLVWDVCLFAHTHPHPHTDTYTDTDKYTHTHMCTHFFFGVWLE
jgi:hypothetical protein